MGGGDIYGHYINFWLQAVTLHLSQSNRGITRLCKVAYTGAESRLVGRYLGGEFCDLEEVIIACTVAVGK